MVTSTVQIGGVLLFILLLYVFINHNREIQATTSAIREIWRGSCRLSCIRQTPQKEERQVIESRDCQTNQGNQILSDTERCECICDTCPCALIENVLRVCGPVTGFYTNSIDLISRGYYNAMTVLCDVSKTADAEGRGSRQRESKRSINQCGSSDNILFINHKAVKAEEKSDKKEQDFGQWAESVSKKIELKLGRRVEAPVRVSNEQDLKERSAAPAKEKNEESLASKIKEPELDQKTEELISQRKELELGTKAEAPVNQTKEQEYCETTETSSSQKKEPALGQIIELKQLKLLGSAENITFSNPTDVRAEGVKTETGNKKEPRQEAEKEEASGQKKEISFQNESEATVLNELPKYEASQSPTKTNNEKPPDSTPFSTDSKSSVAASSQHNCAKCIAKGEACVRHCTKNNR